MYINSLIYIIQVCFTEIIIVYKLYKFNPRVAYKGLVRNRQTLPDTYFQQSDHRVCI